MRAHVGRWAGVLVAVLAVAQATACGPVPKPFKPPPRQEAASPLVREGAASGVWVEPMAGMSQPMSMLLTEAVAAGFKLYGIRATTDGTRHARYRLRGEAEVTGGGAPPPYPVLIHWTLFDYDGKPIGMKTQGVKGSRDEWDYGSPRIIGAIGETAPEILAALIEKEEESLKPVQPRVAGVWVEPITSAPGDGPRSLTWAIKEALGGAGLKIADDRRYAEFVLTGRVGLKPAEDGLERVEVVWTVLEPDGREVGRATQRNLVRAGTFDGAWGEVAAIVAEAAKEGIEGVLRAAGARQFAPKRTSRVLKMAPPDPNRGIVLPLPTLTIETPPLGNKDN